MPGKTNSLYILINEPRGLIGQFPQSVQLKKVLKPLK